MVLLFMAENFCKKEIRLTSIFLGRVRLAVAGQVAASVQRTEVLKSQPTRNRIGLDDGHVEIDQMTIVQNRPLGGTDPVRIMTGPTRGPLLQVPLVLRKTLVTENAVSTVATVAEFIG
jgi:hypothetical protein